LILVLGSAKAIICGKYICFYAGMDHISTSLPMLIGNVLFFAGILLLGCYCLFNSIEIEYSKK
jgi:hypothetical protein